MQENTLKNINIKGQTPNLELLSNAWKEMRGQWGISIGFHLLLILMLMASGCLYVLQFLIICPLLLGNCRFWLNISRRTNPEISDLFSGFSTYGTILGASMLVTLICYGGLILLIIPGIYWGLSYSMVYYIIADNPNVGINESLVLSRKMMYGHKWKLFFFWLASQGIILVSFFLTCGIGSLWVFPWVSVAYAKFYDDIKEPIEDIQQTPAAQKNISN